MKQGNEAVPIGLPLMSFSTRGMPAPRATYAQVAAQLPFGLDHGLRVIEQRVRQQGEKRPIQLDMLHLF